jgi:hypothetical protein
MPRPRRLARRFPARAARGLLLATGVLTAGVLVVGAGPASAGGHAAPWRATAWCARPSHQRARVICAMPVRLPRACPFIGSQAQWPVQSTCIQPLPCPLLPALRRGIRPRVMAPGAIVSGRGAVKVAWPRYFRGISPIAGVPCIGGIGLPGPCHVFFVAPPANRQFFAHRPRQATKPQVAVLPPLGEALRCAGTMPEAPCGSYAGTSVRPGMPAAPGIAGIKPEPRGRLVCIGGYRQG